MNLIPVNKFSLHAILVGLFLATSSIAQASQEDFEALIYAIEKDDFETFQELLESGADPNFIGQDGRSPRWVLCETARLRPLNWMKTLEENGADISHIRLDYASHGGLAIYASALFCSLLSIRTDTFIYLANSNLFPVSDICHLCTNPFYKSSIVEYAVQSKKFKKVIWLIDNTTYAKDMISKRVISDLNRSLGIRQDRLTEFWNLVDKVRDMGYEVTPSIPR